MRNAELASTIPNSAFRIPRSIGPCPAATLRPSAGGFERADLRRREALGTLLRDLSQDAIDFRLQAASFFLGRIVRVNDAHLGPWRAAKQPRQPVRRQQ